MRVLVVDDSTYIRSRIKTILEANGHTVVGLAENGEEAIDMAVELMPDLITLDNILPDMSGIDVLKALKDQKGMTKVVMISAVGQQSAIAEGLACGASDYLVKPFQDTDLIEIIQKL
jgi:two-component system chemotaxis response regulator CheY